MSTLSPNFLQKMWVYIRWVSVSEFQSHSLDIGKNTCFANERQWFHNSLMSEGRVIEYQRFGKVTKKSHPLSPTLTCKSGNTSLLVWRLWKLRIQNKNKRFYWNFFQEILVYVLQLLIHSFMTFLETELAQICMKMWDSI